MIQVTFQVQGGSTLPLLPGWGESHIEQGRLGVSPASFRDPWHLALSAIAPNQNGPSKPERDSPKGPHQAWPRVWCTVNGGRDDAPKSLLIG
jgi:hypothetical protein